MEPLFPHAGCLAIVTSRYRFVLPNLHRQDLDALKLEAAKDFLLSLAPRLGDAAGDLAQLLGCLPLALRLAGSAFAEQPGLKPADYVQMFAEREGQLADVERAIAFNYEGLAEQHRLMWRSLAVFPGGFDVEAAASVWGVDTKAAQSVLDLNLYCVSLVEHRDGRYRLHDLARDFASTQLENEERQNAARRHAGHYVSVLSKADQLYEAGGAQITEGLALFDGEWRNIQAGQAWAADHSSNDPEAAKYCSEYPDAGAYCLNLRLHPREWVIWLKAGHSAAVEIGDRRMEGAALGNLGIAYATLGEPRRAIEYYEQQLPIAREMGDRLGEGLASWNLGLVYEKQGDLHRAAELMQVLVDFEREIGHRDAEEDAATVEGIRARLAESS